MSSTGMMSSTSRPWLLSAQQHSLLGADSLTQPGTPLRELLHSKPIITKRLSMDIVSIWQDCHQHPLKWLSSILSKSLQKVHVITTLLANVTFPNIRVNLRNLEDINCPPFYQLCPTTPPWSIIQKALWLASWLADHGLAKKISLTAINRPQRTFFLAAFCCCTVNY